MQIPVFTYNFRKTLGKYALYAAISSFVIHLLLHLLRQYIPGGMQAGLLADPINAIYTPFSILLGVRGVFDDLLPAPKHHLIYREAIRSDRI